MRKKRLFFSSFLTFMFCAALSGAVSAEEKATQAPTETSAPSPSSNKSAEGRDEGQLIVGEKHVPVLMYHFVSNDSGRLGKYVISPKDFENDLNLLRENGYETVVMSDIIAFVKNGEPLPEKPVVLSFDDGDVGIANFVYPLLEKYSSKIVVSIIGKDTDDCTEDFHKNGYTQPHLTWEQVKQLSDSGLVEIQNHSYNLHKGIGAKKRSGESDAAYRERLRADISKAQAKIAEVTGKEPNTFTYPFGAISDSSDEILKELGFQATLSCYESPQSIKAGDDKTTFSIRRLLRRCWMSADEILKKLQKTTPDY